MNDYVNNIVARTLGLAPVVQPRLGSLFEPLSIATTTKEFPSFESETARGDQSPRNSTLEVPLRTLVPHADEVQPAMNREPKSRGVDRAVSSAGDADTQERPVDTVIRHSTLIPSAPLINARLARSSLVSKADSEGLRFEAQTHEPHEPQVNSPAFDEREPNGLENSPRRGPRLHEMEAEYRDQTRATPNPRDRAQFLRARTTHEAPSAIALIQPNRLAVSQSRKAFAEATIPSEVPPTINVTIGRVDVRAVFSRPAAPSVSRAKQPAAMSLDEYLKRRSEGL